MWPVRGSRAPPVASPRPRRTGWVAGSSRFRAIGESARGGWRASWRRVNCSCLQINRSRPSNHPFLALNTRAAPRYAGDREGTPMLGGMQDWALRVTHLIDHAAREAGMRGIVTRWGDGRIERTSWAGVARDARKMASAFVQLGIKPADRIATLAMNHHRHLTAWYGAIGCGGVIHTVNVRLFDEQLVCIINHAEDR